MIKTRNITGIIPAAGFARRIAPLYCSKEVYPIMQPNGNSRAVSSYLLETYAKAQADKNYFIIRKGKWDIPEYYRDESIPGNSTAFIITEATPGVPFTIDKAYSFIKDDLVLLGFPDIIFKPIDAFKCLLRKQEDSRADLVLGLFEVENHKNTDMVAFSEEGQINDIIIKPAYTDLSQTWMIAAWTPAFSLFLHQYVKQYKPMQKSGELHLGDVFRSAIRTGLKTSYVLFKEGRYLDIGTPGNLGKAQNIDWLE